MLLNLGKALKQRLSLPLPGSDAQHKMAHAERRINLARLKIPENPRMGAVLILLYEVNGTVRFPLIVRSVYEGVHSGQVALPGGGIESVDKNLEATSIREAVEETGIEKKQVEILGRLSELYIPPSNFLVTPFIGMYSGKPVFVPHAREVVQIVEMDMEKLMDEKLIREKNIRLSSGMNILTPYFDFDGLTVWGATAMILSEFKSVLFEIENQFEE